MKKHVSLFLALLMLFSALFALPAEAAQIQDEQAPENTHIASLSERFAAPRATDPDVGTNAVVTPGTGGGCAHTYNTVRYNGNYHKRVCRKCGSYYLVAHTFKYSTSSSTHRKYCSVCGFSYSSAAHSISYIPTGNVHVICCAVCGYSFGSECHSFSKPTIHNELQHSLTCSKCQSKCYESHSLKFEYQYYDARWRSEGLIATVYRCTVCQGGVTKHLPIGVPPEKTRDGNVEK